MPTMINPLNGTGSSIKTKAPPSGLSGAGAAIIASNPLGKKIGNI